MNSTPLNHHLLKAEALRLGFSACGIAPADRVDTHTARIFHQWLAEGRQADMHYLENHEPLRLDPRLLFPGAQSVICVALNYYPRQSLRPDQLQFAYYAYGRDYHDVMREKLSLLANAVLADGTFRICCDTAPILDRYWAWRAGLGWIGKNSNLILPHLGSYFFLGEILSTAPSDHYDQPLPNHCGTCHRCVDACPTGALRADAPIDARRCLSYLTIENRGPIPPEAAQQMGNTIYGCDRCQQACPHNRFALPTSEDNFTPSSAFLTMTPADWHTLTPERYRELFRGSAVKRAKYEGLMRNITVRPHSDSNPDSEANS